MSAGAQVLLAALNLQPDSIELTHSKRKLPESKYKENTEN